MEKLREKKERAGFVTTSLLDLPYLLEAVLVLNCCCLTRSEGSSGVPDAAWGEDIKLCVNGIARMYQENAFHFGIVCKKRRNALSKASPSQRRLL